MPDLILRPTGLDDKRFEYALQLRFHDCCGPTEYQTLIRCSLDEARQIVSAGAPFWLFSEPGAK